MADWLIVLSDHPRDGAPKGEPLVRFLRCFLGDAVEVISPDELLSGPGVQADTIFVALPSSLGDSHLMRLRGRRFVLFDYYDEPEPEWGESDQALLRGLTDRYLKTHITSIPGCGLKLGLLPVDYMSSVGREYERLCSRRPFRRLGSWVGREERPWDLTLLGSVTHLQKAAPDGSPHRYHQRVDWVREALARPDWRFWGGLFELPYFGRAELEADCGPVDGVLWQGGRLRFSELFRRMSRTKIALAPLGHARWTFRHLEAVYAGCEVLSTDLSGVRTLIPLPIHCFETVPDHAPLAPFVERALGAWPRGAARREAALEHFETYLLHGRYDRRRPRVLDTFLAQLG